MNLRSLALVLTVGLMVGIGPLAAQDTTPEPTAEASGAATGSLLEFLRYVPDTADYRKMVNYGDKAAWLKSWDVPNITSLDAINTLDDLPRKRWLFIMPTQTLVPQALGLEYLMTGDDLKFYGFDFFAADRYIEAGQPPNMVTVVDGQFNTAAIDTSLKKIGYSTTDLQPDGTLYSLRGDKSDGHDR